MDKYIELMAFYWVDWQQTALANTRYSVVLAVLAFFIGVIVIAIIKSFKISKLSKRLIESHQQLEQAQTKLEKLENEQKESAALITDQQQQLDQTENTLQQEREDFKKQLEDKEALIISLTKEKQAEIDAINTTLSEKNKLLEQLQHSLEEQRDVVAKATTAQEQIAELEKRLASSTAELNLAKQQLEAQTKISNEQVTQLVKQEQSTKIQINRVLELESQLATLNDTHAVEKAQHLVIDKEQEQKDLLSQEANKPEVKQEVPEIITSVSPKKEALIEDKISTTPSKEQITVEKVSSVPHKVEEETVVAQKQPKPAKQPKPEKSKQVASSTPKKSKSGFVSKAMGWFSSMDNALDGGDAQNSPQVATNKSEEEKPAKAITPDPVIQNTKQEGVSTMVEKPSEISVPKVEAAKQKTVKKNEIMDEEESSFSEKLADVADKMDSFQSKFKGFFNKDKS
ncbi:MAG: hypothetical protein QM500_01615 [Methylococcales bacterium]